MRVLVATEYHFWLYRGEILCRGPGKYSFWLRYLDVFDHVTVLARVGKLISRPNDLSLAEGEGVSFSLIPNYQGPLQYLRNRPMIVREIRKHSKINQAFILRAPGQIASVLHRHLKKRKYPFGVEVVGDPLDVFAPDVLRVPFSFFFRWLFAKRLKEQCAGASCAAYVNRVTLPSHYPVSHGAMWTNYSSIDLRSSSFVSSPREIVVLTAPVRLISVGYMTQPYKGFDILIEAIRICVESGLDLTLVLVGDGVLRAGLEVQAASIGLHDRVSFTGNLPAGQRVREELDKSDLFIQPSKTEGMPRSTIEAMARALPCIGTAVGGTKELLPPENMVAPNDPHALARKIMEVTSDPSRMSNMSRENLETAKKFSHDLISKRRKEFYGTLKANTAEVLSESFLV